MKRKLVTKNTGKNKSYKKIVNIFEGEGEEPNKLSKFEETLGAIGSGLSGIVGAASANAEVDTTEADNAIESVSSYKPATDSLDALANSYNNLNFATTDYNYRDLMVDPGTGLANMGKAVFSGATSGASIGGGWGALAGGIVGALGSGAGWLLGKSNAKQDARRLERDAILANNSARSLAIDARDDIMSNEYNNLMRNIAAKGGKISTKPSHIFKSGGAMHQHGGIFSNGVTFIDSGGTHEENPFEGVQIGVDYEGIPNLVEEGEVIWNDYVFSNRLKVPGKKHTFAVEAEELQKESEERPNDLISKRGLEDSMTKLIQLQEMVRQQDKEKSTNKFNKEGVKNRINKFDSGSWLRYMPAIGSGLATLSDAFGLTNKPNYSNIEGIKETTSAIKPVGYTPIDTKMTYTPFDTQFYGAKLAEQNAATKQAIQNTAQTSGQAMAGLLAADYNNVGKLGDLYRQAEEYNQAQRERVLGFNRQTDAMNSEMAMKAAIVNQADNKLRLNSAIAQAQMRDQIEAQANAGRSANLSNLFTNLGNIGTDMFNRQLSDMLLSSGVYGTLSMKPAWWSDKQWADYQDGVAAQRATLTPPTTPSTSIQSPSVYTDSTAYMQDEDFRDKYGVYYKKGGSIKRRRKIKKGLTY